MRSVDVHVDVVVVVDVHVDVDGFFIRGPAAPTKPQMHRFLERTYWAG